MVWRPRPMHTAQTTVPILLICNIHARSACTNSVYLQYLHNIKGVSVKSTGPPCHLWSLNNFELYFLDQKKTWFTLLSQQQLYVTMCFNFTLSIHSILQFMQNYDLLTKKEYFYLSNQFIAIAHFFLISCMQVHISWPISESFHTKDLSYIILWSWHTNHYINLYSWHAIWGGVSHILLKLTKNSCLNIDLWHAISSHSVMINSLALSHWEWLLFYIDPSKK